MAIGTPGGGGVSEGALASATDTSVHAFFIGGGLAFALFGDGTHFSPGACTHALAFGDGCTVSGDGTMSGAAVAVGVCGFLFTTSWNCSMIERVSDSGGVGGRCRCGMSVGGAFGMHACFMSGVSLSA